MGSPLGLKPVVDRLAPHGHRRPPGVNRWFNLTGNGDVVAMPRDGVPRHFEAVTHREIAVGAVNPHAATSYLGSPAVAVILADLLRRRGAPSESPCTAPRAGTTPVCGPRKPLP